MPFCLVCGTRATGIHYGVQSCEGCKAFYKRALTHSLAYTCYFGKTCFDAEQRVISCKACRLQKCVQVGMKLDGSKRGRRQKDKRPPATKLLWNGSDVGRFRAIAPAPSATSTVETPSLAVIEVRPIASEACSPDLTQENRSVCALSRASVSTFHDSFNVHSDMFRTLAMPGQTSPNLCYRDKWLDDSIAKIQPKHRSLIDNYRFTVEDTIHTVKSAMEMIYAEQVHRWGTFMRDCIENGNVPHQPQVTVAQMIAATRNSVGQIQRKGSDFYFQLPGFSALSEEDQKTIMAEKWSETWLVAHAPFMRNGESYYLIGENYDIHYSRYWMRQLLDPAHIKLIYFFAAELNSLALTPLEYHLFHAVATLNPDTTTAKNKKFLSFLAGHYMKCLLCSIRSRCMAAEQVLVEERIRNFIRLFRSIYRLGQFYVRSLDYTTPPPFKAVKDTTVITVQEALSLEEDGLAAPSPVRLL